jgi:hypothetical protein
MRDVETIILVQHRTPGISTLRWRWNAYNHEQYHNVHPCSWNKLRMCSYVSKQG